jgi:hypothetical protein
VHCEPKYEEDFCDCKVVSRRVVNGLHGPFLCWLREYLLLSHRADRPFVAHSGRGVMRFMVSSLLLQPSGRSCSDPCSCSHGQKDCCRSP